jgi:peptidoglycan/LPS O-acetylase OafA/YrhL
MRLPSLDVTDRRRDIQGLRGVAVLMVIAFHAGLGVLGGFTGVDIFFVISGFVITGSLVGELSRDARINLPGFYARRVKRLLPALTVMVTFVALAGVLLDPEAATRISALTGVFASFFSANVYLATLASGYFDVSAQLDPFLHTWTLAVEEQFYLVFPVILFAAWRLGTLARGPRAGRVLAFIAIAAVSWNSVVLASTWSTSHRSFAYYGSPARAWEFGIGCLIALAAPALRRLPLLAAAAFAAVGLTAIALTALETSGSGSLLMIAIVPTLAAGALIVAGFARNNSLSRVLGARGLVRIGDLSYSLYLWHWPLIVWAKALVPGSGWAAPIGAAMSFAPAWLSFRYVENPIRFSRAIRGRNVFALAAICVAVPAVASAAVTNLKLASASTYAGGFHADYTSGCDQPAPFGDISRRGCEWVAPKAKGTVVLIGDSNAGHFTEPVIRASRAANFDLNVATFSSCPFVQLRFVDAGVDSDECERFVTASLAALLRARPSLVIIGTRSDAWIESSDHGLGKLGGNGVAYGASTKAVLLASGLRSEAVALTNADIPVVIVHPVPLLAVDQPGCAVILIMTGGCNGTVSRRAADAELRRTLDAELEAVHGLPQASVLNLEDEICERTKCSIERAGVTMYRNINHLSIPGALTLTPEFSHVIRAHARTRSTQ